MSDKTNPFDDPEIARRYEAWYVGAGLKADAAEKALLARLLAEVPRVESALEVGCGTGHFVRWLESLGLSATGVDISLPMLTECARLKSPPCIQADAIHLPFADRSFDLAAFVTTLEFLDDPLMCLREALRVTRRGLLLGVLNGHSPLGLRRLRAEGPIWSGANLFTPSELEKLVMDAAEDRSIRVKWRTTLGPLPWIRHSRLPWGGFIGMAVVMENDQFPSRR